MIDAENGPEAEAEATDAAEIDVTAEIPAAESESEAEGGEGSGAEAPGEPEGGAGEVEAVIAVEIPADFTVPMVHPDNGSIDGIETEQRGDVTVFLVPQELVAAYESHGFVNIAGEDA